MTRRSGDGAGLLAAFRAGADNLAAHVDEVNALNVFPVPDGDTGSNMLATVRAALAEAETVSGQPADRIAQAISYGALMGARGNSGVIASQIFRGMAEGLGGKHQFNGADLAHALTQGTATAYKAVGKPVEGTILTVIRESAAAAVAAADAGRDLEGVLAAAVEGARQAVARTPAMLPVLRDAGVVDAGGQGLYRIMQGTHQYMVARVPTRAPTVARTLSRAVAPAVPIDEAFGYETMFVLRSRGKALEIDWLRAELEKLGESVLVAGDAKTLKVHVHNERPDQIIALGLSVGTLTRITVENLDAQSHEVREKRAAEVVGAPIEHHVRVAHHEGRPHVDLGTYGAEVEALSGASNGSNGGSGAASAHGAEVRGVDVAVPPVPASPVATGNASTASVSAPSVPLAIVAVTSGEGLARIFESFGVAAVVRGGQSNNPSTGELLDAVEKVVADEILLLPNNPNVVLAARQASEMTSRRVRVVPTRNAAEGYAALLAMDPARDATANAEVMTLAGRAVQTLQVTEAVRDATVGGHKVKKGQTIVLDPDDGLLAVGIDRMKAILTALEALDPGFELVTIYYGEGADLGEAELLAGRIGKWRAGLEVEVLHGGQPHYRYLVSAE